MALKFAQVELDRVTKWTSEVDLILSSLDAAGHQPRFDRRDLQRLCYRVIATLRLYSQDSDEESLLLFTRDVDARGMGFITQTALPLGFGGRVWIETPGGFDIETGCTIHRCRPLAGGWYEGAMNFNRPQPAFAVGRG